jgi:hypothetical protein
MFNIFFQAVFGPGKSGADVTLSQIVPALSLPEPAEWRSGGLMARNHNKNNLISLDFA